MRTKTADSISSSGIKAGPPSSPVPGQRNNRTFDTGTLVTTRHQPRFTLLAADIDGAARTDFVSSNADSNNVCCISGNGTTFTGNTTQDYAVGMGPVPGRGRSFNRERNDRCVVTANINGNDLSVLLRRYK